MAWFLACRSLQNLLLDGKDKLAGAAPTEGNNTPAVLRAPTHAPVIAPLIHFGSSSMPKYSKNDFQRIFKNVLDF